MHCLPGSSSGETKSGVKLSCSYRRYVSMDCRNLIVQKMRFCPEDGSLLLSMKGTVDEKVKTNGYTYFHPCGKTEI